jgi:plasmid maintenance system antidote protein VapI
MSRRSKKTGVNWSTRSRYVKPAQLPDIGSFVKAEMKELDLSPAGMAAKLKVSPGRVYRLLKDPDWKVTDIINVSTLLANNLFGWYAQATGAPDTSAQLQQQLTETRAELEKARAEIAVLEKALKLLGR